MSGDGIGLLVGAVVAVAVAPILLAGTVVVGAIYGAMELVSFLADEHRKHTAIRKQEQKRRAAELAKKTAEERAQLNTVLSGFHALEEKQEEAKKSLDQKFAAQFSAAAREMQQNQQQANADIQQLVKGFEQKSNQLFTEWKQSSEALHTTYATSVGTSISNLKKSVQNGMDAIASLKAAQQLEDAKMQQYAKDQLEQASLALEAFRLELGEEPNAVLVNNLGQAQFYYDGGLFENAYSTASSVVMGCYDALEAALVKREKVYALMDQVETQAIFQQARIDALKNFTFSYREQSYEEDLTRFVPDLFQAIGARLEGIKQQLGTTDLATLLAASHDLDDIETDVDEAIQLAVTQLLYAYAENDTAADITEAMESQGFEVEDYAYKKDVEGNAIHINYVNPISAEKVTVVLTPSPQGIKVDVHNFGADAPGAPADVARQTQIRELLEQTLEIQISCQNLGQASTHTDAADLDAVKKIGLN